MLVYFCISLVVLLGFVGLAIDVGRMELRTIQLQAVADDAAMTAAAEYQNGNTNWQTVSNLEVTSAAAATGLSNVSSAFQMHSTTGAYTLDYSAIQATITQSFPLYFMGLITGSKTNTLTAISVADAQPCSYFTNPNLFPNNSIKLSSTSLWGSCPLYAVGSITNDYFSNMQSGQIKVTGASATSPDTGGRFYSSSKPIYNAPVLPDPLAYVTPPTFSACTPLAIGLRITVPTTLTPGTYCGGVTIIGTTVTLLPGLYIITGGLTLLSSTMQGTGVTLYFTQGGGYSFGNIALGNYTTSYMNLSAPTDSTGGGIPAIALYTDPAWTGTGGINFAGCSWHGDGIFYSKVAPISVVYGNVYGDNYFGMDTYALYEYQANVFVSSNYAPLPGGNPFHIAATLVQ